MTLPRLLVSLLLLVGHVLPCSSVRLINHVDEDDGGSGGTISSAGQEQHSLDRRLAAGGGGWGVSLGGALGAEGRFKALRGESFTAAEPVDQVVQAAVAPAASGEDPQSRTPACPKNAKFNYCAMDLTCEVTCEDMLEGKTDAKACNRRCYQRCECEQGHLTLRGFCVSTDDCRSIMAAMTPLRKRQVMDQILDGFSPNDRLAGIAGVGGGGGIVPPSVGGSSSLLQGPNLIQQLENLVNWPQAGEEVDAAMQGLLDAVGAVLDPMGELMEEGGEEGEGAGRARGAAAAARQGPGAGRQQQQQQQRVVEVDVNPAGGATTTTTTTEEEDGDGGGDGRGAAVGSSRTTTTATKVKDAGASSSAAASPPPSLP